MADGLVAKRKLIEALVRAERPAEALEVFAARDLPSDSETTFWQAQALAALDRWAAALPLYQKAASDEKAARRAEAAFGEAEALRALGQKERALEVLSPARERACLEYAGKVRPGPVVDRARQLAAADRLLRETKPRLPTERSERRFLFGRLNLAEGIPVRAIETLSVHFERTRKASRIGCSSPRSSRWPRRTSRRKSRRRAITPWRNSSIITLTTPALPAIFARLDELYRMERKPSTNELERWLRDPAQPRQALAQWYFARSCPPLRGSGSSSRAPDRVA